MIIIQHAALYAYMTSLVPRPIPSFSACNIEKLGMGLGTRLYMIMIMIMRVHHACTRRRICNLAPWPGSLASQTFPFLRVKVWLARLMARRQLDKPRADESAKERA